MWWKPRPYKRTGQACSPVLIAKLIQIGFVLNMGPEASE